ncbi:DUF2625 family protein [Streptomyces sp. NPDC001652]|uniref:DUF2625 family protein n=1 Tax=Streptomyces sp. NPDC001652 TaxID=3154393 RepID=UPI00333117F4
MGLAAGAHHRTRPDDHVGHRRRPGGGGPLDPAPPWAAIILGCGRSTNSAPDAGHRTLGALAWNCGGLVLDDGWVRVFGGGSEASVGLPSLAQVNRFPDAFDPDWFPEAAT